MNKISLVLMAALSCLSISVVNAGFFTPASQVNSNLWIHNSYGASLYVKASKKRMATRGDEVVTLENGKRIPCGNLCLYQSGAVELYISTQISPTYTDLSSYINPYLPQLVGKKNIIITIKPSGYRENWNILVGYED